MTNPKPVYLPPGVDPTQIERPLSPAGCMRYVWLVALFVGLCGGISLGAGLFGAKATPAITPTITSTLTPNPTITPTFRPGESPTPAPTQTPIIINQIRLITATPGATYTPTPVTCWYWHTIAQGETLSALSIHFGVSVATIMAWNGLKNANLILWGFALRIKTTCNAATTPPTNRAASIQPAIEVF